MANTISRILSDDTLNRIIQIESAGNPNAKAPTSSAAGLGQFILATWNETVQKHRPDLIKDGAAPSRLGNGTVALQLEMLARFTEDNARALGAGYTDGDLYLAHFLGMGDARKLLRASPDKSAALVVSPAAVTANRSILAGKTCGQVRAWAQESMRSRWERAGRPDWIKKFAGSPVTMPATKPKPSAGEVTGGVAGGAVVVGGASAAAEAGWSGTEIAILVAVLLAVGAGAFFAWRWWRAKQAREAEVAHVGLLAVADAVPEAASTETAGADALAAEIANKAKGGVACQVAADEMAKPVARKKRKPKKPAKRKRRAS